MSRCPTCGGVPKRTDTRYGLRLDCCGLWAWGEHPLADRETHEARKAAHAAFDPLWKSGQLKRGYAYKLLAEAMGMTRDECHMKLMTAEQAKRVPAIAARIRTRTSNDESNYPDRTDPDFGGMPEGGAANRPSWW